AKAAGQRAQQRRLVCLVVAMLGIVDAFYVQKNSLSWQTALAFAAGLLALLAAGEMTVRILDRRSNRQGHTDRGAAAEEPVGALLESLSRGGVILHHIWGAQGPIEHLVFRPEGVVFLIATQPESGRVAEEAGEFRLNGRPLPRQLFKQARRKLDWLRGVLRAQLGCEARLEAGLLFSNADVAAGYQSEGVALLGLEHLQPWLDTAEPDDEFGKRLWPQMEQLKTQLLAASESPSLRALAVPPGVVLLLGILWLAISASPAARQTVAPGPAGGPAQPAQLAHKVAALFSGIKEPLAPPAWVKEIHLEGLSGAPPHRLAIINRKTFAVGESATIKVSGRDVSIRCVNILGESATIALEGVAGTTELCLRDGPLKPEASGSPQ
ncbi:MAG TPA: hypothetical protein VNT26_15125, partial [Candidatus Sulfotelmatobacter sp.]|nr:hypothetical protein [Candidatus Sulfotelmatobacter sp.]